MQTQDAIHQRRAVKHYDPEFQMPVEDETRLKTLIRQSPTSFNLQNWRFVIVKDTEKRTAIREAAWGQAQVTDASLLLILCADINAWDKNPQKYWQDAPKEAQDILVPMIKPFYEGREWQQRDEAMRSIGIAAQTIMLSAKDMGYDTCPMIGFDGDQVASIINLPDDHVIGMIITVGKAIKPAWDKPGFLADEEVFFENSF
ncbi:MAG: nitroreductase family protein [Bdellovibrionales bacterium]